MPPLGTLVSSPQAPPLRPQPGRAKWAVSDPRTRRQGAGCEQVSGRVCRGVSARRLACLGRARGRGFVRQTCSHSGAPWSGRVRSPVPGVLFGACSSARRLAGRHCVAVCPCWSADTRGDESLCPGARGTAQGGSLTAKTVSVGGGRRGGAVGSHASPGRQRFFCKKLALLLKHERRPPLFLF